MRCCLASFPATSAPDCGGIWAAAVGAAVVAELAVARGAIAAEAEFTGIGDVAEEAADATALAVTVATDGAAVVAVCVAAPCVGAACIETGAVADDDAIVMIFGAPTITGDLSAK